MTNYQCLNRRLALLLALFMACVAQAQEVGQKAKLNHVAAFDGTKFDPTTVEGKPTLIYFWASWCPICRQEMPVLEKHYRAYKDKGFNIIAVNFRDEERPARALLETIKPVSYVVGRIDDNWRTDYPNLHGTPTWYLLDKRGVIRKVVIGKQVISGGWFDGLEGELKRAIAE